MRTPPVHCRAIQVSSPTGELKRIPVSGLTKARLLWLFRNFSILDFSVLNKKQQQLIATMWQASPNGRSTGASLDLIGCIEGFSLTESQPSAPAALASSPPPRERTDARTPVTTSGPQKPTGGRRRPRSLGARAWTAAIVLLLCAIYIRTSLLRPQPADPQPAIPAPELVSQSRVATPAAPEMKAPESASPPRASSPKAQAVAQPSPPRLQAHLSAPKHLPDAMARQESVAAVSPARTRSAPVPKAPPEVLLRVQVDTNGRPQTFEIVQGKRTTLAAAMAAAKRWRFPPCSASATCEHLLRFIDHGDTSSVQVIN